MLIRVSYLDKRNNFQYNVGKNRRRLHAIFFLLPFIVFGSMILYGVLTNTKFVGKGWLECFACIGI